MAKPKGVITSKVRQPGFRVPVNEVELPYRQPKKKKPKFKKGLRVRMVEVVDADWQDF